MIRILCTGDSHTWGQGVAGCLEGYDPPLVEGDLRLTTFEKDTYVNILRREIEKVTHSYSREWTAIDVAETAHIEYDKPCAVIDKDEIVLEIEGSILRIEYALDQQPAVLEIKLDGSVYDCLNLPAGKNDHDYHLWTGLFEEGKHSISICSQKGKIRIYRMESYGGSYAVINGGVGSNSVREFTERYWADHVEAVRPSIAVAEAHSINDWLRKGTLETYYADLKAFVEKYQSMGTKVILLTVSPILEEQIPDRNPIPYDQYIEVSRKVAMDTGAILCDANAIMKLCLSGMNETESLQYLLDDALHPNERGHGIYAELIKQVVKIVSRIETYE